MSPGTGHHWLLWSGIGAGLDPGHQPAVLAVDELRFDDDPGARFLGRRLLQALTHRLRQQRLAPWAAQPHHRAP